MENGKKIRCINLDWLEVYCLESNERYPCNARYYERQGYHVREREYGTRVYKEMFEIVDDFGNPLIEIRREPASGNSEFHGLLPQSTHIRLPNWMLYQGNPIDYLRDFLVKNDYIFKRIYRIDVAYDFERFDSGDRPSAFVRRLLEGKYRKINQTELSTHGKDNWGSYDCNSLSWGSRSSMVTTKLYNKSLELRQGKSDKPWIKSAWMIHGLIDNPDSMTKFDDKGQLQKVDIWRVEFSMMSAADGWIVMEFTNGKRQRKQTIPHKLNMFDSKDKLWERFQDLAYNYFHFKHAEFIQPKRGLTGVALDKVNSTVEKRPQRKDRCRDKILFYWDAHHEFKRIACAPSDSPKQTQEQILLRRLKHYRDTHLNPDIVKACAVIIENIEKFAALRFVPYGDDPNAKALQIALMRHLGGDKRSTMQIIAEVQALLDNNEIF